MRPLPSLRNQRDFQRLFRGGVRYRGRYLTLVARPAEAGALRASPICSKKVGGAVVRNRMRRRLREMLRLSAWRQGAGADLAVITHPPAAQAGYRALAEELHRLLERAGLLQEAER